MKCILTSIILSKQTVECLFGIVVTIGARLGTSPGISGRRGGRRSFGFFSYDLFDDLFADDGLHDLGDLALGDGRDGDVDLLGLVEGGLHTILVLLAEGVVLGALGAALLRHVPERELTLAVYASLPVEEWG
jgi:hypothetical protein